jgi:hypothetical protein
MRAKPYFPVMLSLAFLLMIPAAQPAPGVAQSSELPAASPPEEAAHAETPGSLPHFRFLWDYLLVAALLAGALYAVCRSSRRI